MEKGIILSIGNGRLHLVQAAYWIATTPPHIRVIGGWIPTNPNNFLVRLASHIVKRNLSPGFKKRLVIKGVCEIRTCTSAEIFQEVLRPFCRRLGISGDYGVAFSWGLFGFLSRRYINKRFTVFHVRSGAGQGGAIRKAKRLGLKVLCDHSIAHPEFMEKQLRSECERNGVHFDSIVFSPFWKMVDKDCQEADIVMVNSFFVRDTFLEAGYAPEKIRVVYQGTREDFFSLRSAEPYFDGKRPLRILFTGAFGFRKGGEYILGALKELHNRGISFTMDVVGSYAGSQSIRQKYDAETLPITFHGPVPQDDLKQFLRSADVYLFPSLAEGCASSGLEAMAAGLCTVATHESGLPITDDETGYLVPSKDSAAIISRIEWLIAHPEAIERTGRAAAKLIAADYTWDKYAENVKKIYEELEQV